MKVRDLNNFKQKQDNVAYLLLFNERTQFKVTYKLPLTMTKVSYRDDTLNEGKRRKPE
jgi:hypothetical protein